MALVYKDRVKETTTTTGTGTVTLAGAVAGFQAFSVVGNGNTCYYTIVLGSEWEVGLGTYTSSGTTLSRDSVLASSNSNALVNFSAGTKSVFLTLPADAIGVAGNSIAQGNSSVVVTDTGTDGHIALSTEGTERMLVDAAGNVGIGTSSPTTPLEVAANANSLNVSLRGSGTNVSILRFLSQDALTTYALIRGASNEFRLNCQANAPMTMYTNNTERMRIDAAGNVGIGTSSPASLCHINGTIRYTNRPAAGTITAIGYDANGDLKNSSSSLRYKHDVKTYGKGLSELMQLRPVTFKFNGEDRTNAGFIAEEIDALGLEEVMLYDEEGRPDGVLYANMVALLTKAIQEQQEIIDSLKARLDALENA